MIGVNILSHIVRYFISFSNRRKLQNSNYHKKKCNYLGLNIFETSTSVFSKTHNIILSLQFNYKLVQIFRKVSYMKMEIEHAFSQRFHKLIHPSIIHNGQAILFKINNPLTTGLRIFSCTNNIKYLKHECLFFLPNVLCITYRQLFFPKEQSIYFISAQFRKTRTSIFTIFAQYSLHVIYSSDITLTDFQMRLTSMYLNSIFTHNSLLIYNMVSLIDF